MQKVITVYSKVESMGSRNAKFSVEHITYPELDELFADGFKVLQVISESIGFERSSLTLLLEKENQISSPE